MRKPFKYRKRPTTREHCQYHGKWKRDSTVTEDFGHWLKVTDSILITKERLAQGMAGGIGINKDQAKCLGIPYPLIKGWKSKVIGTHISKEDFEIFLAIKGLKKRQRHKRCPALQVKAKRKPKKPSARRIAKMWEDLGKPYLPSKERRSDTGGQQGEVDREYQTIFSQI